MPLNLKHIYDGWKNFAIKNPVVETEAKRRAAICSTCEYSGTNVLGANVCTECGCPLAFKTRNINANYSNPENKGGAKW